MDVSSFSSILTRSSPPPEDLQFNENVDFNPVTIKTEDPETDDDNDDGLRVQVLNLYCYECKTLFQDSDSFHRHIRSFHNQNQKENPVSKPRTRSSADNSQLKAKANKRISTILKSTNSWNSYDQDENCLEGKDRILVECKKCRKNYTSLSAFLKHLKTKKKKIVEKEDDSQQDLSSDIEPQLLTPQENGECQSETKVEEEEKWEAGENENLDSDSNFSTSTSQVQVQNELENEHGQDCDEWNSGSESEFENNFNKKKKRTNSKSPKKKKSTKTIKQKAANTTKKKVSKQSRKFPSKAGPSPKCCNMCNFSTPYLKDLREHKRTTHEGQKPFMCHLCSEFFKSEAILQKHMKVHERNVQCPECGKSFGDVAHRNIHMAVHRDERPFLCPEPNCPFATFGFKFKTNLTAHFVGVHQNPEEMLQCVHCKKLFKTKALLRCHMRIHAEGRSKRFACDHPGCDKAYFYAHHLVYHRRDTHLAVEKNIHCPICNKAFQRNKTMQTHVKITHYGQKNHICDVCGKGFGKSYSLTVHQRSHTGVRLFPCALCPKAYTTKQQLINHNLKCRPPQNQDQDQDFLPPTQPPNNNNNNENYTGSE